MMRNLKQFADLQYKQFSARHGQQLIDILEFPIKLVLSPFTLAYDIAGSAPRGFGIPEFISKLSFSAIFVSYHLMNDPICICMFCVNVWMCFLVGACNLVKWVCEFWEFSGCLGCYLSFGQVGHDCTSCLCFCLSGVHMYTSDLMGVWKFWLTWYLLV